MDKVGLPRCWGDCSIIFRQAVALAGMGATHSGGAAPRARNCSDGSNRGGGWSSGLKRKSFSNTKKSVSGSNRPSVMKGKATSCSQGAHGRQHEQKHDSKGGRLTSGHAAMNESMHWAMKSAPVYTASNRIHTMLMCCKGVLPEVPHSLLARTSGSRLPGPAEHVQRPHRRQRVHEVGVQISWQFELVGQHECLMNKISRSC